MTELVEATGDLGEVVYAAMEAFANQRVAVRETGGGARRSWTGVLARTRIHHDPARGGDVVILDFNDGRRERLEFAAAEVTSVDFGTPEGDRHPRLTVMSGTGTTIITPEDALKQHEQRTAPPRSAMASPHVERCETHLAVLWATHAHHDLYVRDERRAGAAGVAHVEPIIGRFTGVDRDGDGWTLAFGDHRVQVPYDINGTPKVMLPTGVPALLAIDAPGGRILISES
jgi:hypothetical protein